MILVERNERDIVNVTRDGEELGTFSSSAMALQFLGKLWAERDAARNLIREYAEACNDVIAHLGEPGANDRLTRHALAHEALMRFGESEAK